MPFTLPKLTYSYGALEPVIDAKTMEIHHSKHHAGYTNKLNATLEKHTELESKTIEELLTNLYEAVEGCLSVDVDPPKQTPGNTRVMEISV